MDQASAVLVITGLIVGMAVCLALGIEGIYRANFEEGDRP